MTTLTKSVTRLVTTTSFGPLVLTLAPEGIYFRHPRQPKRNAVLLPHGRAYQNAAWLAAEKRRRDKAAKRAEARKARKAGAR